MVFAKSVFLIYNNFSLNFPIFHKVSYWRPQEFFRGEARSTKGGLVRGVAAWGVRGGRSPPDAGEVCKKFVKNQGKIDIFLILQEIFRFFQKVSNFLSNFPRKSGQQFRKF